MTRAARRIRDELSIERTRNQCADRRETLGLTRAAVEAAAILDEDAIAIRRAHPLDREPDPWYGTPSVHPQFADIIGKRFSRAGV
jgi:hypothetical protein